MSIALRAGELSYTHIGMLIRLPGRLTGDPLHWEDTVAPIIMVILWGRWRASLSAVLAAARWSSDDDWRDGEKLCRASR